MTANGGLLKWSKRRDSKSRRPVTPVLGFKSLTLRQISTVILIQSHGAIFFAQKPKNTGVFIVILLVCLPGEELLCRGFACFLINVGSFIIIYRGCFKGRTDGNNLIFTRLDRLRNTVVLLLLERHLGNRCTQRIPRCLFDENLVPYSFDQGRTLVVLQQLIMATITPVMIPAR